MLVIMAGVLSVPVAAEEKSSAFLLMKNTGMATSGQVIDSGLPGPKLLVIGGIHGDEPAGMEAAKQISALKPATGKLVLIPVANRLAAEAGVRTPYFMQDLNRTFPGKQSGNDTQKLAASIMGVIERYRPAVVIDLHEADPVTDSGAKETADTLILSEEGRAAEIALAVLETMNTESAGKRFSFLSGAPQGSLNREVSRRLKIPVITVETDKRDPLKVRIETQLNMVKRIAEAVEGRSR